MLKKKYRRRHLSSLMSAIDNNEDYLKMCIRDRARTSQDLVKYQKNKLLVKDFKHLKENFLILLNKSLKLSLIHI